MGYGFYYGGDSRKFHPDEECCTEKEKNDHKAACQLWNDLEAKGETPTPDECLSGWKTLGDGTVVHILASQYGIGTYEMEVEDDDPNFEEGVPEDDDGVPLL